MTSLVKKKKKSLWKRLEIVNARELKTFLAQGYFILRFVLMLLLHPQHTNEHTHIHIHTYFFLYHLKVAYIITLYSDTSVCIP